MKHINLNTLLVSIGIAFGGWIGNEVYKEIKQTHDAIVVIQTEIPRMVTKTEFELKILEIKTKIANIEIELDKLRHDKKSFN